LPLEIYQMERSDIKRLLLLWFKNIRLLWARWMSRFEQRGHDTGPVGLFTSRRGIFCRFCFAASGQRRAGCEFGALIWLGGTAALDGFAPVETACERSVSRNVSILVWHQTAAPGHVG
jgi:hypothetical protein